MHLPETLTRIPLLGELLRRGYLQERWRREKDLVVQTGGMEAILGLVTDLRGKGKKIIIDESEKGWIPYILVLREIEPRENSGVWCTGVALTVSLQELVVCNSRGFGFWGPLDKSSRYQGDPRSKKDGTISLREKLIIAKELANCNLFDESEGGIELAVGKFVKLRTIE